MDAFWNSRRRPFHWHLFDLMSSWAVVCDVWYLEPQTRRPDESAIEFAARVKVGFCHKDLFYISVSNGSSFCLENDN